MRFTVLKLCVLLMTCDFISCQGYFTLTGQNFIKDQSIYHAMVAYEGYKTSEVLQVRILDSETRNKTIIDKKVTLAGTGSQRIEFDFRKLPVANYLLEAMTLSTKFKRSISLNMNTIKNVVLFQTDKAKYKPSDKVQFRVLIVNPETQPQNVSNVAIHITDAENNRVKQYNNIVLNKGVFQGELQLAELAILGMWQIHASVNAEKFSKSFEVAKYTLPNIIMSIETDSLISYSEGKLSAKVVAKYTFGQLAKGKATVVAEVQGTYVYGTRPPTKPPQTTSRPTSTTTRLGSTTSGRTVSSTLSTSPPTTRSQPLPSIGRGVPRGGYYVPGAKVSKTIEVDGKKPVVFDLENELELKDKTQQRYITLTATFIDELTGREITAEASVVVKQVVLTLSWDYFYQFKPALPIQIVANVQNKNLPVTDSKNPVVFTITLVSDKLRMCNEGTPNAYQCREQIKTNKTLKAYPVNGFAKIEFTSELNTDSIQINGKYLGVEYTQYAYAIRETKSKEYLQVKQLNENAKFSEKLKFNVQTTKVVSGVTYQIQAKGDVVVSKYISTGQRRSFNIEVAPTLKMIPNAYLIVHYITNDGEIISDSLSIKFGNELQNFVNLKLSKEKAEPGDQINIRVRAKANSYVGLLGVDQSVLLLQSGNDIESKTVFQNLQQSSYPNVYNQIYYYDPNNQYQYYRSFNQGYSFIITNSKPTYQEPYIPLYSDATTTRKGVPERTTRRPEQPGMPSPQQPQQRAPSAPRGPAGPSGPSEEGPVVEIRKEFPETWFFDSLDFNRRTASANLRKKVPDTITSWIITGFSLNAQSGLGLTQQPTKLTVFRPFFVATDLPYSIKRGEVIVIKIQVFNYQDEDVEAKVVLHNIDEEFEYAEVGADQKLICTRETEKAKTVKVKAQSGAAVNFLIRPLKVGQITIKVVATTHNAGDGLEKQLIVEPEGITQYVNKAFLIDLTEQSEFDTYIGIDVPSNAVPDSTKIEASVIGDVLGPTFENLENLLRIPYGCGEQNMVGFVPNILVIEYLTSVKKLTSEIESKAKKNMETGYQRQLTFKHDDGSYSSWGRTGSPSGSTWLTAYVAKSFIKASKYILIDEKVIEQALSFLAKTQKADGSFPEVGRASYLQGGASNGLAITAYTLITFLERKDPNNKYQATITKGLNYIIENLKSLDDTYSVAITAYALQVADHPDKDQVLKLLNSRSINKNGLKYWERAIPESQKNNPYYYRPNEINVEMSAYGLLAFLISEQIEESVAIMRWLVTQRNKYGGFTSTQDTVVGIQALSAIGAKIYSPNNEMHITLTPYDEEPTEIKVNEANALIVQKFELSSDARDFDIYADGQGLSILQISYRYNVDFAAQFPRFKLSPKVNAKSTKSFLSLTICTSFIPDSSANKSNMAVLETSLPSGFTLDSESSAQLLATPSVKKVELKSGATIVVVYFDEVTTTEICVNIDSYRAYEVALQKPSSVIIFDYYDNTRQAQSLYTIPAINPCDICNGDTTCLRNCKKN